jgi:adenine-specific DNA-methyltransferase
VFATEPAWNQLKMPFGQEGTRGGASPRLLLSERVATFWQKLQRLKSHLPAELPAEDSVEERYAFACAATKCVLQAYWTRLQDGHGRVWPLLRLDSSTVLPALDEQTCDLFEEVGAVLSQYEPISAGYMAGEIYTALLPAKFRTHHGVFYTPPALTARLMNLASQAGVEWAKAHVLDPGCGGGAFLTPVALKMVEALGGKDPRCLLDHVSTHLRGFELDPFSAWMSQVLLESALIDLCRAAGKRMPRIVKICDALLAEPGRDPVDLVIGNPPYGRVTLAPELRDRYRRSLYGHANAYGVFMDLAVCWARPGGVIAYITPTGFLGGHYFKELRSLMAREAPPVSIDLVTSRKGVFSNVLQETLLATYRKGGEARGTSTHLVSLRDMVSLEVIPVGSFSLPAVPTDPWLIPRNSQQAALISRLRNMPHRLSDYGYKVSTGPLVWNRHKPQLHVHPVEGAYPILWAECVTSEGRFEHRTEKKNHKPYLRPKRGQEWLLVQEPCVLVQRTTAKEQRRRLLAAELPARFIRRFGAVAVENHLNMVRRTCGTPAVSLPVIAALLNSETVDAVFRCISGSVAVSATELESLPLPPPEAVRPLEAMLEAGADRETLSGYIRGLYLRERSDVAA